MAKGSKQNQKKMASKASKQNKKAKVNKKAN